MAAYEDSYKSQLQGVSQQVARERLDGQVAAQDNMLSDAVTNLRRRPGALFAYSLPTGGGESAYRYKTLDTVVGGKKCQVVLDCTAGVVYVLDTADNLLYTSGPVPYLQATYHTDIQTATCNGELFLVNRTRKPGRGPTTTSVSYNRAFMHIRAGVFNKKYLANLGVGDTGISVTYITPDGSAAGDADKTTPTYIAQQLATALSALPGVTVTVDGDCLAVVAGDAIVGLNTDAGLSSAITSGYNHIRQESDLPPRLPVSMDGYIIATGDSRAKRYYQWNSTTKEWLECGDTSSPLTLDNVPVTLTHSGGVWGIGSLPFEGRFAGDDDTNPDPEFMRSGITGVGSYQGRLVLLAGNMACLSASNNPRRFYRSTVTTLSDADTIGIGSTGTTAATYEHAVQFNKDLLLFSDKNQAVLPAGNAAITPRTAAMLSTSEYASDMQMCPIQVGRGLMFSAPRSSTHFGFMEMLPSAQTDSMYVSSDSTPHLPLYMPGRCRFGVSSSVSSLALFAPTDALNTLIVHEYIWAGDEKVQQAWHRWTFPFPVASAYFSGDSVVLLFQLAGNLVACRVEPKGSAFDGADRVPFLDLAAYVDVVDRTFTLPEWLAAALPTAEDKRKIRLMVATGAMAGAEVGYDYIGGYRTALSFKNGRVALGIPYTSLVSPTQPMRKDSNGVKVSTNKMTVLRFAVGTNKSGPFEVAVADTTDEGYSDQYGPVFYHSPELQLGTPVIGADSTVVVPARTRAENTVLTLSADGLSEFNLVGLEFVAQYHEKIRRKQ